MQLRPLATASSQLGLALLAWLVGWGPGSVPAQTVRPPYRRALPPQLDASATADVFFDDVFTQGTVGPRPRSLRATAAPHRLDAANADSPKAKRDKPRAKQPRRKR